MVTKLTIREALRTGAEHIARRDDLRDNATRDAQQLMEIATGLSRVQMLAQPERVLAEEEQGSFFGMVAQRRGGVPVQHLRGSQEFFGRDFFVTPDVLIPRPETEGIVEEVLRLYPDRNAALRIADVGTGSGILAITLALEYPQSRVTALDISTSALDVAQKNAVNLDAQDRVEFIESDLFGALDEAVVFDLIVSNPPYIPLTEAAELHPQVLDHEPHLALFGGNDGHDVLRRLIPDAAYRLKRGSWLLLETAGRTATLDALLENNWNSHYVRDLQCIERITGAQRS
jgi:release factor glutamine methyltransferase